MKHLYICSVALALALSAAAKAENVGVDIICTTSHTYGALHIDKVHDMVEPWHEIEVPHSTVIVEQTREDHFKAYYEGEPESAVECPYSRTVSVHGHLDLVTRGATCPINSTEHNHPHMLLLGEDTEFMIFANGGFFESSHNDAAFTVSAGHCKRR